MSTVLQQFNYQSAVLRLTASYICHHSTLPTFNLFFRKYQLSSNDANVLYYCISTIIDVRSNSIKQLLHHIVKYELLPVILPLLLLSYYYVSLYDVNILADDRDERMNK